MCKHSVMLTEETCSWCSGLEEKKQNEYKKNCKERTEYNRRRNKLQELSIQTAHRHKENITEEDRIYFIKESAGTTRQKDIETLYNIAYQLERRLGAIEWWHRMTWENENYLMSIRNKPKILKEVKHIMERFLKTKKEIGY